jgi:hypothetical protein
VGWFQLSCRSSGEVSAYNIHQPSDIISRTKHLQIIAINIMWHEPFMINMEILFLSIFCLSLSLSLSLSLTHTHTHTTHTHIWTVFITNHKPGYKSPNLTRALLYTKFLLKLPRNFTTKFDWGLQKINSHFPGVFILSETGIERRDNEKTHFVIAKANNSMEP